jgi:hypothetical protein
LPRLRTASPSPRSIPTSGGWWHGRPWDETAPRRRGGPCTTPRPDGWGVPTREPGTRPSWTWAGRSACRGHGATGVRSRRRARSAPPAEPRCRAFVGKGVASRARPGSSGVRWCASCETARGAAWRGSNGPRPSRWTAWQAWWRRSPPTRWCGPDPRRWPVGRRDGFGCRRPDRARKEAGSLSGARSSSFPVCSGAAGASRGCYALDLAFQTSSAMEPGRESVQSCAKKFRPLGMAVESVFS